MRKLALALVLLLGLNGCATATPGAPGPAPAPPVPTTAATSPTGCPALLNLNQADTGTKCVALGGSVDVVLGGLAGQEWAQPQLSATGVLEHGDVRFSAPPYTTFAGYKAVGAGTVDITSSHSACPPPSPGSAGCHAQQAWRITVTVR